MSEPATNADGRSLVAAPHLLHLTTYVAGFADEISDSMIATMTADAHARLASVPPVPVTIRRIGYHPEAVTLLAEPAGALYPHATGGRALPETQVTIKSISLVSETQAGRSWQWQPVAAVFLGDHPE